MEDVEYVKGLLSDDCLKNCLPSGTNSEHTESRNDVDDNLVADKHNVTLDQPYQYIKQEDGDQVVSSESVHIFNELKYQTKQLNLEYSEFACYQHSNSIRYVSLYDDELVKVKVVVSVFNDFTVSIKVCDENLPFGHEIWTGILKVCHSITVLKEILTVVGSYNVCSGNPDPNFQDFFPDGSSLDSTECTKKQGYRDHYTGKSTIFSTSCQTFCRGQRCKSCQAYRGTLRKLLARKQKNNSDETPEKSLIHSRIANSKLSGNQKCLKLKQLADYCKSLEKELDLLRKRTKEIENKYVTQSEKERQDFFQIMNEDSDDTHSIQERKYKQLFFEEQLKYSKLKDKRQMRWHPMLIKWCILLKSKSSSLYDLLRKSGFISLPSERTLYDYTHLPNGTGFQPETVDMIYKEIYGDCDPNELPNSKTDVDILQDKISSDILGDQAVDPIEGNTKRRLNLAAIDSTPLPKRKRYNPISGDKKVNVEMD